MDFNSLIPVITTVSIISVGLTEVIKRLLPSTTPSWVKLIINLVLDAAVTVGYAVVYKAAALDAVIVGVASFAFGQVEYDYVFKMFLEWINKLKSTKD